MQIHRDESGIALLIAIILLLLVSLIGVAALNHSRHEAHSAARSRRQIVNLRYFAGMTEQETADLMGISSRTVAREWRYIRAWLYDQLQA